MGKLERKARAGSSYRAARRNACLRGEIRSTWRGAQARYPMSPPVRPNKRYRDPSADWMRAHPLTAQRRMPLEAIVKLILSGVARAARFA